MPKSKVRKKDDASFRTQAAPTRPAMRPSPAWYPIVMAVLLLLGLAYMVVYYLTNSGTSPNIPVMSGLGAGNFGIGFGLMLVGLIMAVRWR